MENETMTGMIHNLLLGVALVSFLGGCAKEENFVAKQADVVPVPISGELCFSLKFSLNGNGSINRATTDGGDILRLGVNEENAIHSICLFFEDLNSNGTPVGKNPKIWFRVPYPGATPDGQINLKIPQGGDAPQLTTGLKQVYIGVNLSDEQAGCFAEGNKEYALSENYVTSYAYGLSEAYAPGRGIGLVETPGSDYTRKDMAMFCVEDKDQQLLLTEDNDHYMCPKTFILKRNVAKILVTCKVAAPQYVSQGAVDVDYCELAGGLERRGWIRQQDVRFLVNGLNRKSYIMQRATWNADKQLYDYEDPNTDLTDNFTIGTNGIPVPDVSGDFYYSAVQTLNRQSRYYVQTLPYEANRIPDGSNEAGCYYEGLYCPENTFDMSLPSEEDKVIMANYNYPWPMITHVSVTAKFTPRDLFVEKEMATYINEMTGMDLPALSDEMKERIKRLINNGSTETTFPDEVVRITSPSEEISWAILTASLKKHYKVQSDDQIYEESVEGFPENTYLSVVDENGMTEFYTYGAAKLVARRLGGWTETDNPKQLASFKAMPRGRGYYYTYVDNRRSADKEGTQPVYADGQVERDVYYILTISAFSTPGRTGSEPEYIKVHTNVEEWKAGGSADVELN